MQCFGLLGLGPLDGPWKGRSLEEIPSRLASLKRLLFQERKAAASGSITK
jgi:hypothetical protein